MSKHQQQSKAPNKQGTLLGFVQKADGGGGGASGGGNDPAAAIGSPTEVKSSPTAGVGGRGQSSAVCTVDSAVPSVTPRELKPVDDDDDGEEKNNQHGDASTQVTAPASKKGKTSTKQMAGTRKRKQPHASVPAATENTASPQGLEDMSEAVLRQMHERVWGFLAPQGYCRAILIAVLRTKETIANGHLDLTKMMIEFAPQKGEEGQQTKQEDTTTAAAAAEEEVETLVAPKVFSRKGAADVKAKQHRPNAEAVVLSAPTAPAAPAAPAAPVAPAAVATINNDKSNTLKQHSSQVATVVGAAMDGKDEDNVDLPEATPPIKETPDARRRPAEGPETLQTDWRLCAAKVLSSTSTSSSGSEDHVGRDILVSYLRFVDELASRLQWVEVDTTLVDPAALTGRDVRVYWGCDDAWYASIAIHMDNSSLRHCVEYKDSDRAELVLANERIRVLLPVGFCPAPMRESSLRTLASSLERLARIVEVRALQHQLGLDKKKRG